MELSTILLFMALFAGISAFASILKQKRAGSEKYQQILADFEQRVTAMLDADETVEGMCGYKPCAAVTNKRLLVDGKAGIESVDFQQIKKVNGMSASGNKTANPDQMLVLQIKAEKKYTLGNHSQGFNGFVNALMNHVSF